VPSDPPSARVLLRRREIGTRIRDARTWANLTQEALAERVGLSRYTIYRVELGESVARLDWLIVIADACEADLAELVRESPRPPIGGEGPAAT
jgi:transcriptional regulator with XRE-family HTH domain